MLFENVTDKINRLILAGGRNGMTELQFYAAELREWLMSPRRMDQLKGDQYYAGAHDILTRQRTVIGQDGTPEVVTNIPNNKLIDNQYALMVDQKVNYLVGKPITLNCQDKAYAEALTSVFNRRFGRLLKYVAEDALNGGIAWLYPYYNDAGELAFKHFPGYDIFPLWADDDHTELDCALRYYTNEVWDGFQKKIVERVEIFKPDGINAMLSDYQNNMQEDARNTILVLKNYDGENLGEFRKNLATYGAVKVRTVDGSDGGVETLQVEVNASNYDSILNTLKKSLIANVRGYDAKDDRLTGNPNQMNIQSMYSDIDLDANGMESEFQAAFEQLLWFVNQDLANRGVGDFDGVGVQIVFNRDILINETESIENCQKSVGILSTETIVEQHPWVSDVELELARLEAEKAAQTPDYDDAFGGGDDDSGSEE